MKTFPRLLTLLLAALFLATANRSRAAEPAGDEIWVDIRCQDRGLDQPATEYYGVIRRTDFVSLLVNDHPATFVKFTHVAFMENGQVFPLSESNLKGVRLGFKNVMYLRADSILRITELDDAFVSDHLRVLKE